jgi:hypothetical protein
VGRQRPRAIGRVRRLVLASSCAFVALAFLPGGVAGAKERPTTRIWDPRVASIAGAVSRLRGLSFTHPIPVNFVDAHRFEAKAAAEARPTSEADRRWYQNEAGRLRALGLIPAGVDLAKVSTQLTASAELAYYDPQVQEIFVKGTKLDVFGRVTVAHEMTHALDDQNFALQHVESKVHDSTSDLAIASLVEGDAEWVMLRYLGNLDASDHRRYDATDGSVRTALDRQLAGSAIPSILDVTGSVPYSYGALMIDGVRARGGQRALDRLFHRPPTDDRSVLLVEEPPAHGADMVGPVIPLDERRVLPPDRLGTVGLYHVLASRLDAETALHVAADRLDDRMAVTRRPDGVTCVHLALTARDAAGRGRLVDALDTWVAKGAPGAAAVDDAVAIGDGGAPTATDPIQLRACDSGAAPAPPDFTTAATLLVLRSEVANAGVRAHVSRRTLECASDHLLGDPDVAVAITDRFAPEITTSTRLRSAIGTEVASARQACGARLVPRGIGTPG